MARQASLESMRHHACCNQLDLALVKYQRDKRIKKHCVSAFSETIIELNKIDFLTQLKIDKRIEIKN